MTHDLLLLLTLLTAAVGSVALARHYKVPTMLAYLCIGMTLGPHGLRLLEESEQVKTLAEFGIVFLMFSIGLEFNIARLREMRNLVFGFGALQMGLTAFGTSIGTWLGYEQGWRSGLAVGLAVAMSSTAIVARMLSERFELHSLSGRQTMGVLLFQDLAVVPCLILFPALAAPETNLLTALSLAFVQAAFVLFILIWVGQRLMARVFDSVAAYKSDELFVLATLWIVVGLAYATGQFGLSLALGAFVGGMLISETTYRHQVEADVRPFRDILLGFFFVTVGMMVDIRFMLSNFPALILAVTLLVGGKAIVVLIISFAMGNNRDTAFRTGAQLAQAGEFGLVLIELANHLKLVSDDAFQLTLSAMLISMFLAPFMIAYAAKLGGDISNRDWSMKAKHLHDIASKSFCLEEHVIICGYGRSGERIGEFLNAENIPFLALEMDPKRIARAKAAGGNIVFGKADRSEVLKAAGLSRARGIAVAYPDAHSAEQVVQAVRRSRKDIPIIVRVADEADVARLKEAGATEVIPEILEGSLLIAAETLAQIGVPMEQAIKHVRAARAERYASMRSFYQQQDGSS